MTSLASRRFLHGLGLLIGLVLACTACDVAPTQPPAAQPTDAATDDAVPDADGGPGDQAPDDDTPGADGDNDADAGTDDAADGGAVAVDADVVIRPGSDVAAQLRHAGAGDVVRFTKGLYRGVQVEPKANMTFVADDGVVLRGSRLVEGFTQQSGRWVAGGQKAPTAKAVQGQEWGFCATGRDACVQPEDLFLDGKPLRRVATLSQVGRGTWFFDAAAGRVHMGDDPSGRRVELGTTRYAFHGSADGVTIDGFTIEHYATPGRQGAVNPRVGRSGSPGLNWKVTNNTLRYNHGWGVKMESGMRIVGNAIRGNGQGGIGGVANKVVIRGNEVVDNCVAGFKCFGWEGGAMKLHGDDLTVRDNVVRNNRGHGIHTDIGCDRAVISGNVVTDNDGAGIHHEISGSATITGNTLEGNGFRPDGISEPGILVINSDGVDISGNTIAGNAKQIILRQDRRTSDGILRDVAVSDNDVALAGGGNVTVAISQGVSAPGWGQGVTFNDNTYTVAAAARSAKPFTWRGTAMTVEQWTRAGQDTGSEFVTGG